MTTSSSPNGPRLTLIGGGVRSGKSRFAIEQAMGRGSRRCFIATAQAFDDEMTVRIERHQVERGSAFETLEVPIDVPNALGGLQDVDVVVVDCLTLWLSNLLLRGDSEVQIAAAVNDFVDVLRPRRFHALVVTNEVGMGVVPESKLGRQFRDIAGRAHQRLAQDFDEIYLAALGTVVCLRPNPAEHRF